MMYDNPADFLEQNRQKQECLKKALKLAEMKKPGEEVTEMDADDVVNAAKKFHRFLNS